MKEKLCPHCGVELEAKPKGKPRSVPQHRRYFALIKAAYSHWPETHRFRPMSEEHLRKWLQAKAGYATVRTVDTAGMDTQSAIVAVAAMLAAADPMHFTSVQGARFHVIESKSIDFDTLPHLAACALFDAVAEVIEAETGLKADQIMPPVRQSSGKREMMAEVPL
jgi:hypothetical protein